MKLKSMATYYISKIKSYVETIQNKSDTVNTLKPIFKDTFVKNLIDLVTISQRLFILEFKCRQNEKIPSSQLDRELEGIEREYSGLSEEQISEEIIKQSEIAENLMEINNSYNIDK